MIRGWVPPGELSRQYLRIDTSLEPVFHPEAATHVNFLPQNSILILLYLYAVLCLTLKSLQVPRDQVEYMCQLIEALRDHHLDVTEQWKVN